MTTRAIGVPEFDPVTVAEARMHLRNPEITSNDAEIIWFIRSAADQCANNMQRSICTQTWETVLDHFPPRHSYLYSLNHRHHHERAHWGTAIKLPRPVLQSVTSVKYIDENGTLQTLAPEAYVVDTTGTFGTVDAVYGTEWPATRHVTNAVRVRFKGGWSSVNLVPDKIKHWIKLAVTAYGENRSILTENELLLNSFGESLLDDYRIMTFLKHD